VTVSGCGADEPARTPRAHAVQSAGVGGVPHQLPPQAPEGSARSEDGPASPFDISDPRVGNLKPDLLRAVQAAARSAKADGVQFWLTSAWRDRAEQQRLLDEAVRKYGSLKEALHWVSSPGKSAHVTGDAVDVGPTDADSWLSQHGADYGLCQSFANEIWHYELSTTPGGTCPEMLPDGSYR
jgi:D-alanyl-D-alanine carboxypeptidase